MRYARLAVTLLFAGCAIAPDASDRVSPASSASPVTTTAIVRVSGSDTMVNLVQAWAERYRQVEPGVIVEVSGGGSGVGIASLTNRLVDVAATSREMSGAERGRLEQSGQSVVELTVGFDALAVFVHRDNPLTAIALDGLAGIYGDGGQTRRWSQLGLRVPGCASDRIVPIGRQNSSGTYAYFREAVLGPRRDYALGLVDQSGSRDVVALVSRTPCAIGYSGLAYAAPGVHALALASGEGPPVTPTTATAADRSYPLARRLYFYMGDRPSPATATFVAWVQSSEGQQVTASLGFVPTCEVSS